MHNNIFNIQTINGLYNQHYIDHKSLFTYLNKQLPIIHEIFEIDYIKAVQKIKKDYSVHIQNEFSTRWMSKAKSKFEIERYLFVLNDNTVICFTDADACHICTNSDTNSHIAAIQSIINTCRKKEKKKNFEINLIVKESYGLDLKDMSINKTKLDINLMYNDDFQEVDKLLFRRLNKKNDKGIVLLHGLPGTGKTTYLRYLIGRLKKKVLFVSPSIASYITDPEFINILINNPNCILIIEDAENIIMDRNYSGGLSSVSNLLNISDGFLSDCLNVQLICTFNSELSKVDSALMRKGRLIARYHFGKLSTVKAQALSDHIGKTNFISEPMTIAEIYNQDETMYKEHDKSTIGFKQQYQLIQG